MSKAILKSSLVVSVMTMLSRVFGLLRDMAFAHYLGDESGADAFFVAFKIPNLMRRIFAEGAFSQAFIPVLSEYKETNNEQETQQFLASVMGPLGGILILISIIGILIAPLIAMIFAPGWFFDDQQRYNLTTELLRFTIPYMFFISMVACAGGILNTYGKFAVPAFTPVLLNICLISATIFLAPHFEVPAYGVGIGVLIAGVVQLLFQIPFLLKIKVLCWPCWGWAHEGVRKVIKLMIPSIIGSSAAQINLLVGSILASTLVTGSVSWLYYSDRLMELPVGVIGIAIGTVILPNLSKQHIAGSSEKFSSTIDWSLKVVLTITVPATIGLIMLAGPMIATIFGHGKIDLFGVQMASKSLIAYAFGALGFIVVKVLTPAFYARQDTKTPMKYGIISVAVNIAAGIILLFPFDHVGLALATSIAAVINAALLFKEIIKTKIYTPSSGWMKYGAKMALANGLLLVALMFVPAADDWMGWSHLNRGLVLGGIVVAGGCLYFLMLYILRINIGLIKSEK